jgi:hypothetical protein
MKKLTLLPLSFVLTAAILQGCDGNKLQDSKLKTAGIEDTTLVSTANGDKVPEDSEASLADKKEAIQYESYTYTKSFKEEELEKGPSDILDFRKRKNDKFIKVKFTDGHSGTLVFRDGFFYNYTIREKTEVRFASKEDGLQRIWDDSRLLQDAGASIANFAMRKAGPRKKDGTPDMRYRANH